MTELLYATDAYVKEFDAGVTDVRDGALVLDRTAFYATGGGQPHDVGTLTWDGGACRVTEVKKQGPDVLHKIEGAAPAVGTRVHGAIDWERRYALMRHHTALHVVSGVIYQLYGALVTGGQMYVDRARMDFALEDLSPDKLEAIVNEANRLMAAGAPVEDAAVQAEVDLAYQGVCRFWTPDADAFKSLGRMYVEDERFKATYDRIAGGLAEYYRDAMACYADTALN